MRRGTVIDDSYGAEHTYRLAASCHNCGWTGTYKRAFGKRPHPSIDCPACGCNTVDTRPQALPGGKAA